MSRPPIKTRDGLEFIVPSDEKDARITAAVATIRFDTGVFEGLRTLGKG
jgi:hypothetical protein